MGTFAAWFGLIIAVRRPIWGAVRFAAKSEDVSGMQVEPVKWSPQRMRKVLNNAILTGNVGDDMIACAETALGEGFEGSLSRSDTLRYILSSLGTWFAL